MTRHASLNVTRICLIVLFAAPGWTAGFRVGRAAVKITPPAGAPMAGYYFNRAAEGVHDDLWAKAIVLEQGGAKAAIVSCDLIDMPRSTAEQARAAIEKTTGIP